LRKPVGEIKDSCRPHLQLDEREGVVPEHDHFHEQVVLPQREQITHEHRETAVAGQPDNLAFAVLNWAPMACGRALAMDP
jgi:hypothetical protein